MDKITAMKLIPIVKRPGCRRLLFSRAALARWINESSSTQIVEANIVEMYLHKKMPVTKDEYVKL